MNYDYSVIYNGKFYRAGEEVPVKEDKKTEGNTEAKVPKNPDSENTYNEDTEEDTEEEHKKSVKRRTKA